MRFSIQVTQTALVLFVIFTNLGCSDQAQKSQSDTATNSPGETFQTDNELDNNNDTDSLEAISAPVKFPGAGTSGSAEPLAPGVPPETADECSATSSENVPSTVIQQDIECFYGEEDAMKPAASIEQIVEVVEDKEWVHLRLTLDPSFVDNSFGENMMGWEDSKKGQHTFKDLVGSDHAEMLLYDAQDNLALHFKMDYISEDQNSASGYGTLGVLDGDGDMIEGDAESILGVATSLDRNLNGCGLDEYVIDSPKSDENYTLAQEASDWDFRIVYEVWVDAAAFGDAGFGKAIIENVHASPSKQTDNTIEVTPGDCPECNPDVDVCDPWTQCNPEIENCDSDNPPTCNPDVEDCDSDTPPTCNPDVENCDTDGSSDTDSSAIVPE